MCLQTSFAFIFLLFLTDVCRDLCLYLGLDFFSNPLTKDSLPISDLLTTPVSCFRKPVSNRIPKSGTADKCYQPADTASTELQMLLKVILKRRVNEMFLHKVEREGKGAVSSKTF